MIITKLYGGLGNQLFQFWSSVFNLPKETKKYFDSSELQKSKPNFGRKLEIAKIIQIYKNGALLTAGNKIEFFLNQKKFTTIRESESGIFPTNLRSSRIIIDGYWQNKNNLIPNQIDISNFMKKNIGFEFQSNEFNSDEFLIVHVRRGDYFNSPKANAVHGVLSADYFNNYIFEACSKRDFANIVVFSDDISWCQNNLRVFRNIEMTFVNPSHNKGPLNDLIRMSSGKHFILSNSSYSWWAAFLGSDENSLVYMPDQWFKNNFTKSVDLKINNWEIKSTNIN